MIARLQKAFERLEPGGRLEPFGSFAAGLYLPTGDMDLVFLRSSFRGTRISSTGKLAKPLDNRSQGPHLFLNARLQYEQPAVQPVQLAQQCAEAKPEVLAALATQGFGDLFPAALEPLVGKPASPAPPA